MTILKKILFFFCTTCRPNRSPTVRMAFPLMFVAATFLGAQAIMSENSTFITVEPTTNALQAGEPFSLNVYVNAHTPINAVDLELNFPSNEVEVMGIDTGESVITLWTDEPYVAGNTVFLRGGTFRRGFVGEHLIATINVEARQTGVAEFSFGESLLLAGDGAGTEVALTDTDNDSAQVYIADENGQYPNSVSELTGSVDIKIATDIDGDGQVNLSDLSRFMSGWFERDIVYDFNGDGRMTFADFGIILSDSFFR